MIEDLRNKINDINNQIFKLLKERKTISNEIIQNKIKEGKPVDDFKREEEMMTKLVENNKDVDPELIKEVMKAILKDSKKEFYSKALKTKSMGLLREHVNTQSKKTINKNIEELKTIIKEVDKNKINKITIFSTLKCNKKCLTCFANAGPLEKSFNKKLAYNILSNFKGYNVSVAGGEQTLEKEIIDLYKKVGKKYIVTNGSTFSRKTAIKLFDQGITTVMFSLHGHTKELHDNYFQSETFEKLMESFKIANELGFKIRTETAITSKNYKYLKEICDIAKKNNAEESVFLFFIPTGRGKNHPELILSKKQKEEAFESLEKLKMNKNQKIRFFGPCGPNYFKENIYKHHIGKTNNQSAIGGSFCPAGESWFVIDPDGDVYPCSFLIKEKEFKIGTYDANKGLLLTGLEEFLIKKRNLTNTECEDCEINDLCKGGCLAARIFDKNFKCLTKIEESIRKDNI